MPTVFIHGKLRQGCDGHRLIENETFLGTATTDREYALCIVRGAPVVTKRPVSRISGEAYTVSDEALSRIDRTEGHPHVNRRESVPITVADGKTVDAWLYFHVQPLRDYQMIESGDYAETKR